MSVFTRLLTGLLLIAFAGGILIAQQDKPGSEDHPLLSRLPDYFIHDYRQCDFDAHEFRAGSIRETVEGKKTRISYRVKNNANPASDLQILRNCQNAIGKIGGEVPYDSQYQTTLKLAKDGAETWAEVRTSNHGAMFNVTIVEKGLMEQKVTVGGASAPDPKDARDSLDHPLFGRFPGYYIHAYRQSGFEAEQFRAGSIRETVEGKKTTITYNVKSDVHPASDLEILRNYENAIKQAGGEAVYEAAYERTLKLTRDGAENWLGIRTSNQGSMYTLTIVEKEAMEQQVTAQDMLQKLNTEGRVTLYINFDTDKTDIKPESEPVIEEILSALKTDPKLRLLIEGHTDNVGTAAYNQDLSARRAQSVVAALTAKGVAPDRLSAAGFGLEKPIADNSTDEGKAKNRRVELVKQ